MMDTRPIDVAGKKDWNTMERRRRRRAQNIREHNEKFVAAMEEARKDAERTTKLSKREKWLMGEAFRAGRCLSGTLHEWLEEVVDDVGDTVEMALAHDAPTTEPNPGDLRGA